MNISEGQIDPWAVDDDGAVIAGVAAEAWAGAGDGVWADRACVKQTEPITAIESTGAAERARKVSRM
ncbi:MAG: hypothetical protein AABY89_06560 [Acidobacteriota bacterium]